jgi:hypothetical protein
MGDTPWTPRPARSVPAGSGGRAVQGRAWGDENGLPHSPAQFSPQKGEEQMI